MSYKDTPANLDAKLEVIACLKLAAEIVNEYANLSDKDLFKIAELLQRSLHNRQINASTRKEH